MNAIVLCRVSLIITSKSAPYLLLARFIERGKRKKKHTLLGFTFLIHCPLFLLHERIAILPFWFLTYIHVGETGVYISSNNTTTIESISLESGVAFVSFCAVSVLFST